MNHEIPDQFDHEPDAIWTGEDARDGEVMLRQCCADLGVNMAFAIELLAWADKNIPPRGVAGFDWPALRTRCCAELRIKPPFASEFFEWAAEHLQPAPSPGRAAGDSGQAELAASMVKLLEYIFNHASLIHVYAVLYAFGEKCPLLDDIIGHAAPADFAKRIGCTREAVNKAVLAAQKEFRLAPRRGQRGQHARENMSRARKNQLKPEGGARKAELGNRS